MKKKVMRFEGEEQIHSFLDTYPDPYKLTEGLELFHIPEKCIHQIIIQKEDASNLYVIQFHTDQGILFLHDDALI